MESLSEWLASPQAPTVVKPWVDKLLELGASWESFRGNSQDTISVLVSSGFPRLIARDITHSIKTALVLSEAPAAVFWDIDAFPIPEPTRAAEIVARIKALVMTGSSQPLSLRCYSQYSASHSNQSILLELQKTECEIFVAPSQDAEQGTSAMITVDAMTFAYDNFDGANLHFFIREAKYGYLLKKLANRQTWSIHVVTNMKTNIYCECKYKRTSWDTAVLDISKTNNVPPGFEVVTLATTDNSFSCDNILDHSSRPGANSTGSRHDYNGKSNDNAFIHSDDAGSPNALSDTLSSSNSCEPEMVQNETSLPDEVRIPTPPRRLQGLETIQQAIMACSNKSAGKVALKSDVCVSLRSLNPSMFHSDKIIEVFLAREVQQGNIIEFDTQAGKVLKSSSQVAFFDLSRLSTGVTKPQNMPSMIALSKKSPVDFSLLPDKVKAYAKTYPIVLFISKGVIPKQTTFLKVKVQSFNQYLLLLFKAVPDAQSLVASFPYLRKGTLIDCAELYRSVPTPQCMLTGQQQQQAVALVISILNNFAHEDEIVVYEETLLRRLKRDLPDTPEAKQLATACISAAVNSEAVTRFQRVPSVSPNMLCLTSFCSEAMETPPPDDLDTRDEEDHVEDLLWSSTGGCLRRTVIVASLRTTFPLTMSSPLYRARVLHNGMNRNRFYLKRGLRRHFVALTLQDAEHAALTDDRDMSSQATSVDSGRNDSTIEG